MIYKDDFFAKEMKQAHIEKNISNRSQVKFGLFLAVGAFAVYFVLQTLTRSVLTDTIPQFMMASYFSTLSVYNNFIYVCMVIFFFVNYQYVTFAEIRMNRWYLPVSMGFNPLSMIFSKLVARAALILLVYSLGFLTTIFLTSFLKYPFVLDYMLSLYITGLIDLVLLSTITLISSLFLKEQAAAKYVIFTAACVLLVIKVVSGYYSIVSDRALMSDFGAVFDLSKSMYLLIIAVLFIICVTVTIQYARKFAHKYSFPYYKKDLDYAPDVEIVEKAGNLFKSVGPNPNIARVRRTIVNAAGSVILVGVISALLAFNALVLVMSLSSPGRETAVFGTIPYIFSSETMQPELMMNDLIFFEKLDASKPVSVNDIVLYTSNNEVGISRIKEIGPGSITVNVDFYPPEGTPDELKETIIRDDIYGKYIGRSRWLGALILFANTSFGRLTMLLVPVFLVFYHKSIFTFIKKLRQSAHS